MFETMPRTTGETMMRFRLPAELLTANQRHDNDEDDDWLSLVYAHESTMGSSSNQSESSAKRVHSSISQSESSVERVHSSISQSESSVERVHSSISQSESSVERAHSSISQSESSAKRVHSSISQSDHSMAPPTFSSPFTMLTKLLPLIRSRSVPQTFTILLVLLSFLSVQSAFSSPYTSASSSLSSTGARRYPHPFTSSSFYLQHLHNQKNSANVARQQAAPSHASINHQHHSYSPLSATMKSHYLHSNLPTTTSINANNLDQYIVNKCQLNCPLQLNLEDDLDIACNSSCKIEQCEYGCNFWHQRPLSCFDVCQNSTNIDNWIIYCAIGCNHAHLVYVEYVKSLIGTPEAPKLVQGSLRNDSLTIEWGIADRNRLQNLTYRVQWRYAELASTWTYATATDSVPNEQEDGRLKLSSLYAFTGYLFRVEWIVVPWLRISLYSKVSEPIVTLPYGVPTTPCLITSCMSISPTQISLSWQPPMFSNGPIIAYTLYLTDNATGHRLVKDLQMHSEHYQLLLPNSNRSVPMNYVFNGLSPGTQYQLSIVTFNNFGEGPVCRRTISTMAQRSLMSVGGVSSEDQTDENGDEHHHHDRTKPMPEYRHLFTAPGPNSDNQYKLFIASTKEVGRRNPDLLLDEEIIYHLTDYSENSEITGMAIHVLRKYLFVSDSSGTVRRVLLQEDQSINQVLRIIDNSNNPSHLSIDWLNDKLYFLEDNRICRCNLDGDLIESVVTGFRNRPLEMKVDPYNGYLYWLVADSDSQTGLYRVDLAEIVSDRMDRNVAGLLRSSGGVHSLHNSTASATSSGGSSSSSSSTSSIATVNNVQLIYQSSKHRFSTFAVSYFDYRILFPISEAVTGGGGGGGGAAGRSSVYSITIDGKDSVNIRDNSNSADVFVDVESLIIYNEKLYFTKDSNISWEEFHQAESMYYHNIYNTEQRLVSLLVMDYQSQPYPIPLNPVRSVQAVFLDTQAKISWQPPERFGGSGLGAWQHWNYEVSIVEAPEKEEEEEVDDAGDESMDSTHSLSDNSRDFGSTGSTGYLAKVINSTNCVAVELQPDTEYLIKVRAWSIGGKGGWSQRFRGRTLATINSETRTTFAVVSTDEGLLKTDLVGNILDRLISRSKLNGNLINDIAWYRDLILINTESALMAYNHTSQQYNLTRIGNVTNAASISVDRLAPKLYWSNPNERMICRSNLDGTQLEILPILTSANQIVVDSENGFLYWSTVYTIEYQRLNGGGSGSSSGGATTSVSNSKRILFRGNDICSLSLNHEQRVLYWISQTNGDNRLYRMKLIDLNFGLNGEAELPKIESFATISNPNLRGPFAWLSGRMFWLESEQNQIEISDSGVKTFATIKDLKQIYSFAIVSIAGEEEQRSLRHRNVVPLAIDPSSVRIQGNWNNFTLSWLPISNVNYGQVFYDLVIEDMENGKKLNLIQNHTTFRYCFGDRDCQRQQNLSQTLNKIFNYQLKPYSKLIVAIRSFTYWASSKQVVLSLNTPSSIPSKPLEIRVFTYPESDNSLSVNGDSNEDSFDQANTNSVLITAETRWKEPENPNGIILSYTVSLWSTVLGDGPPGSSASSSTGNSKASSSIINKVIPNQLSYRFRNLQPNSTYYFEVRATTDAGEGPASDVLQLKTYHNRPPSRMLLVEPDSLRLADIDLGQSRLIARSLSPLMVDYIYRENILYWIEEGNFLKRITLSNNGIKQSELADLAESSSSSSSSSSGFNNFTLVAHLHERATGLAIDWIGLRVYIATVDRYRNRSSIWFYDHSNAMDSSRSQLHQQNEIIHSVITIQGREIRSLRVNPFTSELIWSESELPLATLATNNGATSSSSFASSFPAILRVCQLENYGTRCSEIRNLFSNNRTELRARSCNCSYSTTVAPSFVVDFTSTAASNGLSKGRIIYYDQQSKYFAVSDMAGCFCRRFSSASGGNHHHQELLSSSSEIVAMSYDSSTIYWKNDTSGVIYRTPVVDLEDLASNFDIQKIQDKDNRTFIDYRPGTIRSLISYNVDHQPYPADLNCLIPHNLRTRVQMLQNTAYSLTLDIETNQTNSYGNLENSLMSSSSSSLSPIDCGRLSLASLHYLIRYRKHFANVQIDCRRADAQQCSTVESFNRTIVVSDLDPFTNYTFLIELDNFYLRQSKYRDLATVTTIYRSQNHNSRKPSGMLQHHNSIYYPTTTIEEDYRILLEDQLVFATAESRPGPPRNVRAIVESPEKIQILWDRPEKLNSMEISYEVRWYSVESSRKSMIRHSDNQTQLGSYFMYLENVRAGKEYNVSVRAYSVDNHQFMDSPPILVRSFDEPNPLKVVKINSRLVLLKWISPSLTSQSTIETHQLNLQQEQDDSLLVGQPSALATTNSLGPVNWTTFVREKTRPHSSYDFIVKNLRPNTRYRFQMSLVYGASKSTYLWPHKFLTLTTKSDVPDVPRLNPVTPIKHPASTLAGTAISVMTTTTTTTITAGQGGNSQDNLSSSITTSTANIFKINWDPVRSNSPDSTIHYLLYSKVLEDGDSDSDDPERGVEDHGDELYHDDDRSYDRIQSEHSVSLAYSDNRARASDFDRTTSLLSKISKDQWNLVYNGTETYWIISGLESGRRHQFRLAARNSVGSSGFSRPTEPFYLPFQNEMYDLNDPGENMLLFVIVLCTTVVLFLLILALFSLHRHQIKEKSLDNGSLNYPIELVPWQELPSHPHLSNALYINSNVESADLGDIEIIDHSNISLSKFLGSGAFGKVYEGLLHKTETRVAVKVLGKGATEDEQLNFLKEAKFMAKFKHPHILQLLGVCLNSDQHIIVMELMEGGDLLKYLRANRPVGLAPSPLTMDDLLTIIIDIAKGSHYLEQIHFVHRDLAARNCLVSSVDRQQRVVKIADFGLTRGLYKQNYYRKEGGLLPVRWMAPESLVDGVFTTQSDVWSFAIIMYEVMTLGQQPYQSLSNSQVLDFVKSGGILSQPNGCPYELYSLMKLCWNYDKEARPSFGEILKDLEDIHHRYREQIMAQPLPSEYINGFMANKQSTSSGVAGPSVGTTGGDLGGLSQFDSLLCSMNSAQNSAQAQLTEPGPSQHQLMTVHNQNYQLARNSGAIYLSGSSLGGYLNGRPTPIYEGGATTHTISTNGIAGDSAATTISSLTSSSSSSSSSAITNGTSSMNNSPDQRNFVDCEGYQIPIRSKTNRSRRPLVATGTTMMEGVHQAQALTTLHDRETLIMN